jgi:hypothetical protein
LSGGVCFLLFPIPGQKFAEPVATEPGQAAKSPATPGFAPITLEIDCDTISGQALNHW